ncbi:filamentous hemagglutinin N-terminal domain-containing protein [Gloeocapsa sp. PCC 73106]|uniref:two-partner secretion domain-containing protein n=1 Tax=Gloeocapsa sp. PCC 73106 TaxID=102232 RepID=UPI0002AC7BD2|nr:filamentous hemagglutinin N-terminal domain-containing protein [Gloeocapsa sp. PCC 73106]ELR99021.1 filamentous hemagglutinin family N-terminal domain protein [Gloeocapsa sp. PCC 73106]
MKPINYQICLISSVLLLSSPVQGQIEADNSLPMPTQVRRVNNGVEIREGTSAGVNLFHSFTNFSVPEGDTANFINNNPAIRNVISRVTGLNPSEILGKIKAGGSATNFNLFLVNPQGIIFGPHASLDLNGSFVATTAEGIQFDNYGYFSAINPNDPSLLRVQPSAFFFNQIRPNSIQVNSQPIGLQVPNKESLILLGGNIAIDGGYLTAPNGRIELGGLNTTGTVRLNSGEHLSLSFPEGVAKANVLIDNFAVINTASNGIGSIAIAAENIRILNYSELQAGISRAQAGEGDNPGAITLNADGKVLIKNSFIANTVGLFPYEDRGIEAIGGKSGDIVIKAGKLDIVALSLIETAVYSAQERADAGNIIFEVPGGHVRLREEGVVLNEDGTVSLFAPLVQSAINTFQDSSVEGNAGNITITAQSLSLSDGSAITASIFGKGDAGDIVIRVEDMVSLKTSTDTEVTQIRTTVENGGNGNAGTIDLQASSLSLKDGAQLAGFVEDEGIGRGSNIIVNVSDFVDISGTEYSGGQNNPSGIYASSDRKVEGQKGIPGNITINTNSLNLSDGGIIISRTANPVPSGQITINAQTIEATGNDTSISAEARVNGTGGDIIITTERLNLLDGAEVKVDSSAQAGNIEINADSLFLQRGAIRAETGANEGEIGANITLNIAESITLSRQSKITATANGQADGGNIAIDTRFLIALPPTRGNGSDIIAKADQGNGGLITIDALGIFNIRQQQAILNNRTNDLDASSETSTGEIRINQEAVFESDFFELPEIIIDPTTLIAQNVCQRGVKSEFFITGRGGLPPGLNDDLSSDATRVDLVEPVLTEVGDARETVETAVESSIVPAQGWVFNERGQIVLVAYDPTVTGSQRLPKTEEVCP